MSTVPAGTSKARYINEMFNDLSSHYDRASSFIALKKDRFWRDYAASQVDGCSAKILDVCCGTGELSIRLKGKSKSPVTAVDFSHGMLAQAKSKYGKKGVRFSVADAEMLPFPDESFTCVTVSFALRNVTSIERTISEMTRVLKKGGKIIILDLGKPRSRLVRKLYYWYFYGVTPKLGGVLADKGDYAYTYLPHSLTYFPAQDGLKKILEDIGLVDVEVHDLTMGIAAVHVGTKAR